MKTYLENYPVKEIAKSASQSSKQQQVLTHLLQRRLSFKENTVTSPRKKKKTYIKRPTYSPSSIERLAFQNRTAIRQSPQHIAQISPSQIKNSQIDDFKISPFKTTKRTGSAQKKPLMISIPVDINSQSMESQSQSNSDENLNKQFTNSNQELPNTIQTSSSTESIDSIQQQDVAPQQNETRESKISISLEPVDQSEKIRVKIDTLKL